MKKHNPKQFWNRVVLLLISLQKIVNRFTNKFPTNSKPKKKKKDISKNFAEDSLVSLISSNLSSKLDTLWDMSRPIDFDCSISFRNSQSNEGKKVLWHSSSHLLGWSLERKFPGIFLCDGPATQEGFFYEFLLPNQQTISITDLKILEEEAQGLMKKQSTSPSFVPFQRMNVSKEFAKQVFSYNPFKLQMLRQIPEKEEISLYRCGDFIDLCKGPHLPHLGKIKDIHMTTTAASIGHLENQKMQLQRVYGISFSDKNGLSVKI
jgi:threonyl-tRNA synthetase